MATLETVKYGGWKNCLRLTDGRTEAVVTTDVGPRVIRFGLVGGPNLLKEHARDLGRTGGKTWRCYGGHRFWVAPEDRLRTYAPDNQEVAWTWKNNVLTLKPKTDRRYNVGKQIRLQYQKDGTLKLVHRLINEGRRAASVAPWALTVMAPGGEAVFPQEPFGPHPEFLDPVRPLVLWAYTDMADPRWTWKAREFRLRQDPRRKAPQKIGFLNKPGWMAYLLNGQAFIKRHAFLPGATYPDFGCNAETFTNHEMLELESLGPLVALKPGVSIDHAECWGLFPIPRQKQLHFLQRKAAIMPL